MKKYTHPFMWLPVALLLVLGGFNNLLASSQQNTSLSQQLVKQFSLEQEQDITPIVRSATPRSDKGLMDFAESLVEVEEEEEVHRAASSKKSHASSSILTAVLPFLVEGIYFTSERGKLFPQLTCATNSSCRYLLYEVFRI
jgi:hypothetical protein